MSRSARNDETINRMGAQPVTTDLFDLDSLTRALCGYDAVYHLAAKIPPMMWVGWRPAWRENDHLRREGTRALVAAALAAGTVHTLIYPSLDLMYPSSGDAWLDAQTSSIDPAPTLVTTAEAEVTVASFAANSTNNRRGISLRMGMFYGTESTMACEMLDYARRGIATLPGARSSYFPMVGVRDAARAFFLALTERVPSGVYDIVDDEPLTREEIFIAMARAVGRQQLLTIPDPVMRLLMGFKYDDMSRSMRISNRLFKAVSTWRPQVPNARSGWRRMVTTDNELLSNQIHKEKNK